MSPITHSAVVNPLISEHLLSNRARGDERQPFRSGAAIAQVRRTRHCRTQIPPLSPPGCMHKSPRSDGSDAAVVTVRSNEYWIASTRAPCFSCARFATVLGLFFPAGSAISRPGEGSPHPLPVSDEIRYFQLIYVRQISAPTLADIVQFHADYDVRLGCRYVINHCERCGASFKRCQVVQFTDGLFNPGRAGPIEFRRCVGPVVAAGRTVPVAHSIAKSLDDLCERAADREAEPGMTSGAARHAGGGREEGLSAGWLPLCGRSRARLAR